MPEYKVTRVSQDPPREWPNPHGGIVYYKKVMLSGHPKPVSIGKKEPDALKVGDTVYGTIDPSDLPEDKFKADKMLPTQHSFGGSARTERPGYHDNSDGQRQGMCFNNAATFVSAHVELLTKVTQPAADHWAKLVYEYANALYKLGDLGKSTDREPLPEPPERNDDEQEAIQRGLAEQFGDDTENIDVSKIPF